MKQELIQLLQHEDYNNVKLGIYVAIANGYNAVDIVDNMYWDSSRFENYKITDFSYQYRFRVSSKHEKFLYFFYRTKYSLRIWNSNDIVDETIEVYYKQYNKTYAQYSQRFIDLILASE